MAAASRGLRTVWLMALPLKLGLYSICVTRGESCLTAEVSRGRSKVVIDKRLHISF